jgi:hypothetical protein
LRQLSPHILPQMLEEMLRQQVLDHQVLDQQALL